MYTEQRKDSMSFDGILYEVDYIGTKYIDGVKYKCYQPSFADCTTIRCEPLNGSEPIFTTAENFYVI